MWCLFFQDLGYTIKNADLATGFIQADGLAESDWLGKFLTGFYANFPDQGHRFR